MLLEATKIRSQTGERSNGGSIILFGIFMPHKLQLRCAFNRGEKKRIACPSFPEVQYDEEASSKGGPHHCAIFIR